MNTVPNQFRLKWLERRVRISSKTFRKWVDSASFPAHFIECKGVGRRRLSIVYYHEWEAWVRTNPDRLAGKSVEVLRSVLRDEDLVHVIVSKHRERRSYRTKPGIPVVRVFPDYRTFGSIKEAANASFVTDGALSFAFRRMRERGDECAECGGYEFVFQKDFDKSWHQRSSNND